MKDLTDRVFTYHINAGDGELITTDLQAGLDIVMPNSYDLENEYDQPDQDGVIMSVTIEIKRFMTQAEVDALPDMY